MKIFIILIFVGLGFSNGFLDNENFISKISNPKIKQSLKEAMVDYKLAIENQPPKYAKNNVIAIADGGSVMYDGNGYTILVMKSLTVIDGVHGYVIGVNITFTNDIIESKLRTFENSRFITKEEYELKYLRR